MHGSPEIERGPRVTPGASLDHLVRALADLNVLSGSEP